MACAPCAAQRKKLLDAAKRGDVVEAVKSAVEGAAAMAGVIPKTELSGYKEAQLALPLDTPPAEETPEERKARRAREAHEKWLAQQPRS